jgi:hypothetical protein
MYGCNITSYDDEYVEITASALGEFEGLTDKVVAGNQERQAYSDDEGDVSGYVECPGPSSGQHCLG